MQQQYWEIQMFLRNSNERIIFFYYKGFFLFLLVLARSVSEFGQRSVVILDRVSQFHRRCIISNRAIELSPNIRMSLLLLPRICCWGRGFSLANLRSIRCFKSGTFRLVLSLRLFRAPVHRLGIVQEVAAWCIRSARFESLLRLQTVCSARVGECELIHRNIARCFTIVAVCEDKFAINS